MADKPGIRGYFNVGDQTNPPDQPLSPGNALAGGDQVFRSMSPFDQELERMRPLVDSKVNNFLEAIAGSPPDESKGLRARWLLQDVLGVDFNRAAREYTKYKQSNPIHRQLTNLVVQHHINSNADSYVNDVLNNRIPYQESVYNSPGASAGSEYQRAVLAGLRNLLQDKNARGAVMKHLMDFRTLEQPIPFVQSKVNWLPPE